VDDDALVRDVIKGALERQYNILEASRYSEARVLVREAFDLALVDYILPDRDGFGVVKIVRERKPSLPVIIMTAYSSEDLVIRALRAGITDYVKKPLVLKYLLKKILLSLPERKKRSPVKKRQGTKNSYLMASRHLCRAIIPKTLTAIASQQSFAWINIPSARNSTSGSDRV
jgi:DNA-binding response OmpR family regulator